MLLLLQYHIGINFFRGEQSSLSKQRNIFICGWNAGVSENGGERATSERKKNEFSSFLFFI